MKSVLTVLVIVCGASATVLDFLKPKPLDGVNRVGVLLLEEELASVPLAVVFVSNDFTEPEAERLSQLVVGKPNAPKVYLAHENVVAETVDGQILVFRSGKKIVYHGLQDAITIAKFVSGLSAGGLKTITGKLDKVAFDRTAGTKIVGYFTVGSPELVTFEEAANLFGTQIGFFVVTDPVVAKHLKLNVTGQIHLVREFDRHPVQCSVNPATLADIQQLIVFNRDSLIKVTPMNALDPALTKLSSILLVTDSSAVSYHILKLIGRSQRNLTVSQPRVLWIDTNEFPDLSVTAEPIHGLSQLPGLGFIDVPANTVQWMDLSVLNKAPADKIQEEANLLLIKHFVSTHFPAPVAAPVQESPKAEL